MDVLDIEGAMLVLERLEALTSPTEAIQHIGE